MPKNFIAYAVLLLCSGGVAYFFDNRLGYTPFLFLIFLAACDFVFVNIYRFLLKIDEVPITQEMTRGEKAIIAFSFSSKCPLFISKAKAYIIFSGDNLEKNYNPHSNLTLCSQCSAKVEFPYTPQHVGTFNIKIKKVVIYSLLGLFSASIRPKKKAKVIVIPKLSGEINIGASCSFGGTESQSSFYKGAKAATAQNSEFYNGVREYEPGDSMHSIHWKLTAHNNKYMTRIYENEDEVGFTIAVDLRKPLCDKRQVLLINDKLIETAVLAASECVASGERAGIIFNNETGNCFFTADTKNDIAVIASRLVTANPSSALDIHQNGNSSVVLFIAKEDKEIVEQLAEIFISGRNIKIIFIAGSMTKKDSEFFGFLEKHKIEYTIINAEDAKQGQPSATQEK